MAYTLSHRIEWKDREGVDSKVEILEDGFTGGVTDCVPAEDPLLIDIAPMDPTIFMPVVGKGATINLVSETNGQFIGMYTLDPIKRMIKCFKNGNASAWWLGYINVEQYGEEYSRLTGYDVTIHCNDGFNALYRFKYLNGTNKYDTLATMWTVLTRVLARTGLPYQYIYFASKISCSGVTPAANETIWHNLEVDQNNYYDEQDEPMTHRAVLEELLKSKGLQIRQECGSIFIYEPQMLADASFSAKRFNGTTYAYVDSVSVSRNFDISDGDTDWEEEDSLVDIKSGYSKQRLRYSHYMPEGAIKEVDLANRFIWTGTETWGEDAYGVVRLSGISAITGITLNAGVTALTGHKNPSSDEEEIYIERAERVADATWMNIEGYFVGRRAGQFMCITGEVYVKTRTWEFSGEDPVVASRIELYMNIEIESAGIRYMIGSGWIWNDPYYSNSFGVTVYKNEDELSICDRWVPFTLVVPWTVPGGKAMFKFYDPDVFAEMAGGSRLDDTDGIKEVRVRNIQCRVREGGTEEADGSVSNGQGAKEAVTDDELFTCNLNVNFMNEAPEITLFHADARNITDRGAIRKTNGDYTTGWRKTGDTSDFKLAHLLLRSIISQYQESNIVLSGTMEADALMDANGGPNFLHTVQDTDQPQCGTKKLMFTGGQYSDFNRTINGTWEEIRVEDITVSVE